MTHENITSTVNIAIQQDLMDDEWSKAGVMINE